MHEDPVPDLFVPSFLNPLSQGACLPAALEVASQEEMLSFILCYQTSLVQSHSDT